MKGQYMEKQTMGEKLTEKPKSPLPDLAEAVRTVREAIRSEEKRLKAIADTDEQPPVLLEGTTSTGHEANIMVDPKEIARIMLDYDFPVYQVLDEEASPDMWNTMARMAGLESASGVDL